MKEIVLIFVLVSQVFIACITKTPPPDIQPITEPVDVEQELESPPQHIESLPIESLPIESLPIDPDIEHTQPFFQVSEDVYEQTFEEIEALISELNEVISRKQFTRWLTFLSDSYIQKYNSEETLHEINQYTHLVENSIVLASLKDYFTWVVEPSRHRAILKEIIFIGEKQVIAYSSYGGQRAKLYEFEKINGRWKISIW